MLAWLATLVAAARRANIDELSVVAYLASFAAAGSPIALFSSTAIGRQQLPWKIPIVGLYALL